MIKIDKIYSNLGAVQILFKWTRAWLRYLLHLVK